MLATTFTAENANNDVDMEHDDDDYKDDNDDDDVLMINGDVDNVDNGAIVYDAANNDAVTNDGILKWHSTDIITRPFDGTSRYVISIEFTEHSVCGLLYPLHLFFKCWIIKHCFKCMSIDTEMMN